MGVAVVVRGKHEVVTEAKLQQAGRGGAGDHLGDAGATVAPSAVAMVADKRHGPRL
jgi:hypothetical protein